jgi:hypothetical protein
MEFHPQRRVDSAGKLTCSLDSCSYRTAGRERQQEVAGGLHRGLAGAHLNKIEPNTRLSAFAPRDSNPAAVRSRCADRWPRRPNAGGRCHGRRVRMSAGRPHDEKVTGLASLSRDHRQVLMIAQKLRRATDATADEARVAREAFLATGPATGACTSGSRRSCCSPAYAGHADPLDPLVLRPRRARDDTPPRRRAGRHTVRGSRCAPTARR